MTDFDPDDVDMDEVDAEMDELESLFGGEGEASEEVTPLSESDVDTLNAEIENLSEEINSQFEGGGTERPESGVVPDVDSETYDPMEGVEDPKIHQDLREQLKGLEWSPSGLNDFGGKGLEGESNFMYRGNSGTVIISSHEEDSRDLIYCVDEEAELNTPEDQQTAYTVVSMLSPYLQEAENGEITITSSEHEEQLVEALTLLDMSLAYDEQQVFNYSE